MNVSLWVDWVLCSSTSSNVSPSVATTLQSYKNIMHCCFSCAVVRIIGKCRHNPLEGERKNALSVSYGNTLLPTQKAPTQKRFAHSITSVQLLLKYDLKAMGKGLNCGDGLELLQMKALRSLPEGRRRGMISIR